MENKVFLTEEGLKQLKERLDFLKVVKRPECSEKIQVARSLGDLSENFEYISAKAGDKITLRVSRRENSLKIDQFIIIPKASFVPQGIVTEISTEIDPIVPITPLPPYNPPAEEHPRVFLRKTD
ncbi:MAG: hypothetical protein IJZ26_02610, partial [Clostridia bacterium]|nr:hypothetical protein [Clostridia bacterium]